MYLRPPLGWLLAAVLICPLSAGAQQWAHGNDTRGSISGTVVLSPGGYPALGIQVKLVSITSGPQWATVTDRDGDFRFAGLPQGTYTLTVQEPGYEMIQETVHVHGYEPGLTLNLKRNGAATAGQNGNLVSARELSIPPKASKEYENGMKSRLKKKDPAGSLSHFQRAVTEFPSYYEAYLQMGLAYWQLGQMAEAEKAIRQSIELSKESFADADFALGQLLDEQERYSDAEKAARQGLLAKPASWVGHYVLGWALLGLNRLKEAEESAQKVLLLKRDYATVHLLLANIHFRTHDQASLLKDLDAYLALEPNGAMSAQVSQMRDAVQHHQAAEAQSAFAATPAKP